MYTVKDIATKFHISEHAVRYYCDEKLIPSLERDKNNRRIFNDIDLQWFQAILCLRSCGMSIKAIKEYVDLCLLGDDTVKARKKIIEEQKKIIEKKLTDLNQSLAFLNYKLDLYNDILHGKIKDITNPLNE